MSKKRNVRKTYGISGDPWDDEVIQRPRTDRISDPSEWDDKSLKRDNRASTPPRAVKRAYRDSRDGHPSEPKKAKDVFEGEAFKKYRSKKITNPKLSSRISRGELVAKLKLALAEKRTRKRALEKETHLLKADISQIGSALKDLDLEYDNFDLRNLNLSDDDDDNTGGWGGSTWEEVSVGERSIQNPTPPSRPKPGSTSFSTARRRITGPANNMSLERKLRLRCKAIQGDDDDD